MWDQGGEMKLKLTPSQLRDLVYMLDQSSEFYVISARYNSLSPTDSAVTMHVSSYETAKEEPLCPPRTPDLPAWMRND